MESYYLGEELFPDKSLVDAKADIDAMFEEHEPTHGAALTKDQIIDRVAMFMLDGYNKLFQSAMANEYYLDEVSADDEISTDDERQSKNPRVRLDPKEWIKKNPDLTDDIYRFVKLRLNLREDLLLTKSKYCLVSYNTLLVGVGLKIALNEELSHGLHQFVVEHLIQPFPTEALKGSNSKAFDVEHNYLRLTSIWFATLYGIYATRGDGVEDKLCGCSAVEEAARKIWLKHKIEFFRSSFTESTLASVHKHRKQYQ